MGKLLYEVVAIAALNCCWALPTVYAAESAPQGDITQTPLTIAEGPFQPTMDSFKQYQCPEWFRDAKFGIWAHWGPQAVPMDGDWYARGMYEQGSRHYQYQI